MDCKTARFLFDYARPRAHELDPGETADLEQHLAGCPECAEALRAVGQVDQVIARAMRQVEVPDRLRTHLLARLDAERTDWYRQRLSYVLRGLAAAGILLVVGWGAWWLSQPSRPTVNIDQLVPWAIQHITDQPPSREHLEAAFSRLYRPVRLPAGLNYSHLACYGLADFQGQQTPRLDFFLRHEDVIQAHASLYVLSDRQFDLAPLTRVNVPPQTGYRTKVSIAYRPGDSYAYVYVYTGDHLDWLKPAGEP
jgi:hypothetical protein